MADLALGSSGDGGFSADHNRAPYTTYKHTIAYFTKEGVMQGKPAGPEGTPAELIRVHAPVSKKVVIWTVEREGEMPTLPDPTPKSDNEYLADKVFFPSNPQLLADGKTRLYSIAGMFTYLLKKPHDPKDGTMTFGKAPFDKGDGGAVVSPGSFSQELLS